MAMQTKQTISSADVAKYFETKMEAEWGPYDLNHAIEERSQEIVILDTRTADAFAEEHIPNAINIPTQELEQRLNELPKDKEIVPYCWTIVCHLATRASLLLARKGYRVHELAGGIGMWKEYKLPVESGAKQPVGAR
jgi:rhodanese-related sulfurtransferase